MSAHYGNDAVCHGAGAAYLQVVEMAEVKWIVFSNNSQDFHISILEGRGEKDKREGGQSIEALNGHTFLNRKNEIKESLNGLRKSTFFTA